MVAAFWQVRDPGNAGTVIRSADAAGCSAVVLVDDCVDVLNPKVIRSTAGSLFHFRFWPWEQTTSLHGAILTSWQCMRPMYMARILDSRNP